MWILVLHLLVLGIHVNLYEGQETNMLSGKTALVTGYTGESGKALVKELIRNKQFEKIILVGRRKVDYIDNEKTEQREIDFDRIDEYAEAFRGADVHLCCLGTTRSKAGVEGFRRVDYDYIVNVARLAKQEGCKQFHLLSSQGANENSLFLYTQVKGQTESFLTKMSFERLAIYRPAMLMVDRVERRPLERLAQTIVSYTIQRIAPEWITTPIDVLARAMTLNSLRKDRPSVEIVDNHAIFRLAEQQLDSMTDKSKATDEL